MGRPATLRVDIVTNDKGAKAGLSSTESRFSKFGGKVAKYGKVAAVGVAAVGTAAFVVGKAVADSASRQQQAFGALDSIYGKNAKTVKAWANSAAEDVGLAASEYGELSSVLGAQLEGMGYSMKRAAGSSNTLIKQGADLAATFGGSTKEAVEALSSALKGERDPIERYGVSIKQADIDAQKAKMGLDGLTGAADKQATAQATLALITDQTRKAHGAFARETDTLAHQQQVLGAKFENVKATVGKKLLPILTKLFTWVNAKLFPAAGRFGRYLAAKFGPVLRQVGDFVRRNVVPALASLWGWVIHKLVPAYKAYLTPILRSVKGVFSQVSSSVNRNSDSLSKLGRFIRKVAEALFPIMKLMGRFIGLALKLSGYVLVGLIDTVATLVDWIDALADKVGWVVDKLDGLKNVGGAVVDKLGGLFSSPITALVSPVTRGTPLAGRGGGPLALGAFGGTGGLDLDTSSALKLSTPIYVDRRDFSTSVQVDGALDAPAVARQLDGILRKHRQSIGKAPTFRSSFATAGDG